MLKVLCWRRQVSVGTAAFETTRGYRVADDLRIWQGFCQGVKGEHKGVYTKSGQDQAPAAHKRHTCDPGEGFGHAGALARVTGKMQLYAAGENRLHALHDTEFQT